MYKYENMILIIFVHMIIQPVGVQGIQGTLIM